MSIVCKIISFLRKKQIFQQKTQKSLVVSQKCSTFAPANEENASI